MIVIRTTLEHPDFEELSKRGVNRATKAAFQAIGDEWQAKLLPKHFRASAAQEYGYRPRSRGYRDKKRRLYRKGKIPRADVALVFTGTLQRLVARRQIVKAFPTRATITIPGPSYLRPKPDTGKPHLAEEILTVSSPERDELAKVGEAALQKALAAELNNRRARTRA